MKKQDTKTSAKSSETRTSRPPQSNAVALKPQIEVVDRRAVTSSVAMAEFFHKQHKDVLKAIRNVVEDCPADFNQRNFAPMFREVEVGNGAVRREPCYQLTRDAFSLVAMGFTGKRAMQWKVAYIKAFNAMEKALRKTRQAMEIPCPEETPYVFQGVPVRARMIDGQYWVSTLDAHKACGLTSYSCRSILKYYHVKPEWTQTIFVTGKNQHKLCLFSVPAIVEFCTRCRPERKERSLSFLRWLVDEVFPSLKPESSTDIRYVTA